MQTTTSDSKPDFVNNARGLAAPILVGAAAVSAAVVTHVLTPGQSGIFPPCPLYATTGIYCPGCGTTRALHALTHGDIAAALHNNVLFVAAAPLAIFAWLAWTSSRMGSSKIRLPRFGKRLSYSLVVVLFAFFVLRNFDVGPLSYLAPIPV